MAAAHRALPNALSWHANTLTVITHAEIPVKLVKNPAVGNASIRVDACWSVVLHVYDSLVIYGALSFYLVAINAPLSVESHVLNLNSARFAVPKKEVNLDDDPIVILQCGHVSTISTLDGTTGMKTVYDYDETKCEWSLGQLPSDFMDLPACPSCRHPITSAFRFRRAKNFAASCVAEKVWISKAVIVGKSLETFINNCFQGRISHPMIATSSTHHQRMQALKEFNKSIQERVRPFEELLEKMPAYLKMCSRSPRRKAYEASTAFLSHSVPPETAKEMLSKSITLPYSTLERKAIMIYARLELSIADVLEKAHQALKERVIPSEVFRKRSKGKLLSAKRTVEDCLRRCRLSGTVEMSENELELLLFEIRMKELETERSDGFDSTSADAFQRSVRQMKDDWKEFMESSLPSFRDRYQNEILLYQSSLKTIGSLISKAALKVTGLPVPMDIHIPLASVVAPCRKLHAPSVNCALGDLAIDLLREIALLP
ncbi:hypothetical protein HDU97_004096 [Phlyctochytrium planicorne]|nr:hypothetical protein HDU97_004096 [Phlyctochytrium planicorne]